MGDLANIEPRTVPAAINDGQETWNVQVFRSIDGGAVAGFPETPKDAASVGLISGENHVIDQSSQDGCISAIL